MPETRCPTESELCDAMRGRSVTAGWDVVVSYRVSRLNEILGRLWEKGNLSDSIKINVPHTQDGVRMLFDVNLLRPTLDFVLDGAADAHLQMGFEGYCYYYTGDVISSKTRIFAGQYEIGFQVPLVSMPAASVNGINPANWVDPSGHPEKLGGLAGDTIAFLDPHDPHATQNIVFKFHDIPKKSWVLHSVDAQGNKNPNVDLDMSRFSDELHTWFVKSVRAVDYTVARVTNTKPSDDKTTYLRPQEFVFASHGQGPSAVLSIYMKTVDSGFASGDKAPQFKFTTPNGVTVELPVPKDSEASIIIRHELMRERLFLPHLKKTFEIKDDNPDPVSNDLGNGEEGFRFKIKVDRKWIKGMENPLGHLWMSNILTPQFLIDLKQSPLTLTISGGKAHWALDYTSPRLGWQRNFHFGGKGLIGAVIVEAKVNKEMPILSSNATLSSTPLTFKASDIKITIKGAPQIKRELSFFESIFAGPQYDRNIWDDHVPDECKNLEVGFPDFSISLASLDYVATKNVFASSQDIVQINTGKGMLSPHDVMLLGRIADP
ncbi:uncharacterized protein LAJ45_07764 [Morchella importuna]|uniref:uncharacterized protein n=1 Tax=Morchella importuna TaxID=1174673 RepID=UPI001E8E1837|nr:uncharacterized protein LAJ45_07764 [Morchella importuna]KAH8148311.1 hypothetical protein LAJ45_07764 [Morchella importuna]